MFLETSCVSERIFGSLRCVCVWGGGQANGSRCEIEGNTEAGVSQLKQGLYYFSTTPPSSSCRQEHGLNEACCLSLVPLPGSQAVPGRPRTKGPLLAFGLGSVLVSSASSVTWGFGTIGLTEPPVLIRRAAVEVSQMTPRCDHLEANRVHDPIQRLFLWCLSVLKVFTSLQLYYPEQRSFYCVVPA